MFKQRKCNKTCAQNFSDNNEDTKGILHNNKNNKSGDTVPFGQGRYSPYIVKDTYIVYFRPLYKGM